MASHVHTWALDDGLDVEMSMIGGGSRPGIWTAARIFREVVPGTGPQLGSVRGYGATETAAIVDLLRACRDRE